MATGNEAYWATYELCRPIPARGVCYLRCPTLNRTLAQLNRLHIIPEPGEPRQASVVELNSPSTQQTCRDRAGHSGIFFFCITQKQTELDKGHTFRGEGRQHWVLGKCTRGKWLKGSECPTQAIPVYTCYSVSRPCEALTKNLLKCKSHSLIFTAPVRSGHACTACVGGGGKPAPQAGTGVRGLATYVINNLSTASELQRYSQSPLNKNKHSQTSRGSSVKQRRTLVAGGHICTKQS